MACELPDGHFPCATKWASAQGRIWAWFNSKAARVAPVGNGLRAVPRGLERHGGRSLQNCDGKVLPCFEPGQDLLLGEHASTLRPHSPVLGKESRQGTAARQAAATAPQGVVDGEPRLAGSGKPLSWSRPHRAAYPLCDCSKEANLRCDNSLVLCAVSVPAAMSV